MSLLRNSVVAALAIVWVAALIEKVSWIRRRAEMWHPVVRALALSDGAAVMALRCAALADMTIVILLLASIRTRGASWALGGLSLVVLGVYSAAGMRFMTTDARTYQAGLRCRCFSLRILEAASPRGLLVRNSLLGALAVVTLVS